MSPRRSSKLENPEESPFLREALQVAYYHCVLEMPLKSIADQLGKSPATITRRLDEVRQAGWLRDRPQFDPPAHLWNELQSHMTCANIEADLQEAFGSNLLSKITVLPTAIRPPEDPTRDSNAASLLRASKFAAHRLSEFLATGPHVVGINWGWSVRQCITNLQPTAPNPELQFLPMVGNLSLDETDPHFEEAIECSSNRLAQAAATAFGAPRAPRLSTPAYIPRRFHKDRAGLLAIRDFIQNDTSYRRIFGDDTQSGLIDQVDTILTGLTSLDVRTLPLYRPNLITEDDIPVLHRAGVLGDIALHLVASLTVPSETAKVAEGRELVKTLNDLIVGASPDDFLRVAQRARGVNPKGLGVVVVAVGPWKAPILTAAIRMGVINELVTDQETAQSIGRELGLHFVNSGQNQ
ncbi:MAG: sugar-binding domain-containing protein [Chthonomonadales bacterium]